MGDRRDFGDGENLELRRWVPVQGTGSWRKKVWKQGIGEGGWGHGARVWGGVEVLVGREAG